MTLGPLPPNSPLLFTNAQPLNKLVEVPQACSKWAEALVDVEADVVVIYQGDTLVLPLKLLELALVDEATFSLALEGFLYRTYGGVNREDFVCMVTILIKLGAKILSERYERGVTELLRVRLPSFSSVLARLIAMEMQEQMVGKVISDMASGLVYVKVGSRWLWGAEAEAYLKKVAQEVGYRTVDHITKDYNIDGLRASSALTTSVISEAVRQVTLWASRPSREVSRLVTQGSKYIICDEGYVNIDLWFRSGVLEKTTSVNAIVVHRLPQISAEVPSGIYEDLEDIERVASTYTPTLLQAMREWVPDPSQRLELWKAMGYTIYPKVPFRKFFLIVGPTSSGKSTFLDFMAHALGFENVASVTLGQLLSSRGEYYAAELYHKLANLADEGVNSAVLERRARSLELLKALVGGSFITARRPYSHPFKFVNYAKLFFATNDEKVVDLLKQDPAVARRMVVIRFKGSFEDNPRFKERLLREAPRALPVLLVALRVLAKRGFSKNVEASKLIEKLRVLCREKCVERKKRGDLFLSARYIHEELGLSAVEVCRILKDNGVPCVYAKAKGGKRGIVLDKDFISL